MVKANFTSTELPQGESLGSERKQYLRRWLHALVRWIRIDEFDGIELDLDSWRIRRLVRKVFARIRKRDPGSWDQIRGEIDKVMWEQSRGSRTSVLDIDRRLVERCRSAPEIEGVIAHTVAGIARSYVDVVLRMTVLERYAPKGERFRSDVEYTLIEACVVRQAYLWGFKHQIEVAAYLLREAVLPGDLAWICDKRMRLTPDFYLRPA